jgi:hypothetical protein
MNCKGNTYFSYFVSMFLLQTNTVILQGGTALDWVWDRHVFEETAFRRIILCILLCVNKKK